MLFLGLPRYNELQSLLKAAARVDDGLGGCVKVSEYGGRPLNILVEHELNAAAGFVSMQSTTLFDRSSRAIGVLITYYATLHHPGPRSLQLLTHFAKAISLLIELGRFRNVAETLLTVPLRARVSAASSDAIHSIAQLDIRVENHPQPLLIRRLETILDALDPPGTVKTA